MAADQGQTTPGVKILMQTETSCHFGHLLQVSKTISLKSDFIQFFSWFYVCIHNPGVGTDNPLGTKFWCQQEHLVTSVICCKLKKISLGLILYIFSMILYMYIAPGQGQTAPRGHSFDVNRNILSFYSFVASSQKMSLKSDFIHLFHDLIHLFHDLIHVYSPGADSPQGSKFWCEHKGNPFVASFKEISLKYDFIHFFSKFNTCI